MWYPKWRENLFIMRFDFLSNYGVYNQHKCNNPFKEPHIKTIYKTSPMYQEAADNKDVYLYKK